MDFLRKRQLLSGKRIVEYLLPWKPNLLPWQPKKGRLWIIKFMTMDGCVSDGKRILGHPLPWKPICSHGNQKRDICGSICPSLPVKLASSGPFCFAYFVVPNLGGGGFEDKCDYFCMVVTVKKRWAHVNIKLFHYYYPVLLHMRVSPREGQLPI